MTGTEWSDAAEQGAQRFAEQRAAAELHASTSVHARLVARYKPSHTAEAFQFDGWALITTTEIGVVLTTHETEAQAQTYATEAMRDGDAVVALVNLATGAEQIPVLMWVANECSWPTCIEVPAPNGRMFLGAPMCRHHTDVSHDVDRAAMDEIAAARGR